MLLPEYVGRRPGGFEAMVELAETIGAGVWDINNALNFPEQASALRVVSTRMRCAASISSSASMSRISRKRRAN